MLVLSRKLGHMFYVGSDVRVTVTRIDRDLVGIGIEAPGLISVRRLDSEFELPRCLLDQTISEWDRNGSTDWS